MLFSRLCFTWESLKNKKNQRKKCKSTGLREIHNVFTYFTFISSSIHPTKSPLIIFQEIISLFLNFRQQPPPISLFYVSVWLSETRWWNPLKFSPTFSPSMLISSIHIYHSIYIHSRVHELCTDYIIILIFPRTSFCFDGENKPQAFFESFSTNT